jgi:hypothetical protein
MLRKYIRHFVLLLICLSMSPCTTAQAQEPATSAPQQDATPFIFLGVAPDHSIDFTRKRQFEDYTLDQQRYCIGCWCNNAFGENLSESFNELVGKSKAFEELWQDIDDCIAPKFNAIPQIRTLPLLPEYDDLDYGAAHFYFSEFLDRPLAARIMVKDTKACLERLTKEYGDPEAIDDTWYVWQRPGSLLLLDLFNVTKHKFPEAELRLYHTETLKQHLEFLQTSTDSAKP